MTGIVGLCVGATAWAQPAIVQKSPADYASQYDKQMPQPRETLKEKKLKQGIRQGAFARQLVGDMKLEGQLPLSASEEDCIRLLNRMGVSPLKGWRRHTPMTEDDFAVVMGKAAGKEVMVHEKAQEVCDEIVDILNVEWIQYHHQTGRYPILEKLITDKSLFPDAEPRCPYGEPYRIGGYQPRVMHHKHLIKSPVKHVLYKERDLLEEAFNKPRPGEEKKTW